MVVAESQALGNATFSLALDVADAGFLLFFANRLEISVSQSRRSWENGGVGIFNPDYSYSIYPLESTTAESRRKNAKVWGKRLEIYSPSMTIRVLMVLACDVTGRNRPIRPRWKDEVGRCQPMEADRVPRSGKPPQRLS
jgi:hypothetical protein